MNQSYANKSLLWYRVGRTVAWTLSAYSAYYICIMFFSEICADASFTLLIIPALLLFSAVFFQCKVVKLTKAEYHTPIWHYRHNDHNIGPLSPKNVSELIASGVITHNTMVWKIGQKEWKPARRMFTKDFKSTPPPPPQLLTAREMPATPSGMNLVGNALSEPKKLGLAIASLVCGIVGGVFSTASIPAIICGHIALSKIRKYPDEYGGVKMAIAGLILGYLGLIPAIILGTMKGILWTQIMQLKKMGY